MSRRQLGSIRETSRGVWRIQVSAGVDPVTRRRRRLDRTFHGTRNEAERELARMLLEVGAVAPTAKNLTVRAYLEDMWLPAMEPPKVRRRTHEGYADKMKTHAYPLIGHVKLTALSSYILDKWLADLARRGVGAQTRLHAFRILRGALEQAVTWGMIEKNPANKHMAPSVPRHEPRILSIEEANAVLDGFAGHPLEPVVVLALAAGLRRSEVAGLLWTDLDLKARTVTIARGMHESHGERWTEAPKSETSDRTVTLPQWACDALRPYRGLGPVVAFGPTAISRRFKARLEELELPPIPLRDLRHTHATLLLAAGVDAVVVSRRLGHSTITVTDRYYLRPGRSADENAADLAETLRRAPSRAKCSDAPSRAK